VQSGAMNNYKLYNHTDKIQNILPQKPLPAAVLTVEIDPKDVTKSIDVKSA
jgi:hypothetical protein